MSKQKKLIISIDDNGDCVIRSPPELDIKEILEILACAIEAAAEQADAVEAKLTKDLVKPADDIKKKEYAN